MGDAAATSSTGTSGAGTSGPGSTFRLIRLIAHRDGIAPAMSRGTAPGQEALLDIMRAATRGDAHAR